MHCSSRLSWARRQRRPSSSRASPQRRQLSSCRRGCARPSGSSRARLRRRPRCSRSSWPQRRRRERPLDAAFRSDRGALERAVQAQLAANAAQRSNRDGTAAAAAQQLADDALALALSGVAQHKQQQPVLAAGEAAAEAGAQVGLLQQEQQTGAATSMRGADGAAASREQPAEATGSPEEAARKAVEGAAAETASALAETPDRAPEQATAAAKGGNAAADLQLDTPLKLDEDIPAAAARDRPDSANIAP